MFEEFKQLFGGEKLEKTPEELRVEGLRARLKELSKERNRIIENSRVLPKGWGVNPRLEQINQEAENIRREINNDAPLIFHGTER